MRAKTLLTTKIQFERAGTRGSQLRKEKGLHADHLFIWWKCHQTVEHKIPNVGSMGLFQCACLELSILNYARVTILKCHLYINISYILNTHTHTSAAQMFLHPTQQELWGWLFARFAVLFFLNVIISFPPPSSPSNSSCTHLLNPYEIHDLYW